MLLFAVIQGVAIWRIGDRPRPEDPARDSGSATASRSGRLSLLPGRAPLRAQELRPGTLALHQAAAHEHNVRVRSVAEVVEQLPDAVLGRAGVLVVAEHVLQGRGGLAASCGPLSPATLRLPLDVRIAGSTSSPV